MLRVFINLVFAFVINIVLLNPCSAQIKATTQDGKKVILSPDGTWKYDLEEIEKDSTLLKKMTVAGDAPAVTPAAIVVPVVVAGSVVADSVKSNQVSVTDSSALVPVVPPPPPVPVRKPPNLECSALLAVEYSVDKDRFVGVLKRLPISQDGKTGFVISFYKTKHGPIIWTTNVMGTGICIDEDTKMNLVLKDGTTFKFANEGGNNCEGNFKLFFGGQSGKEYAFDIIQKMDIRAIRIWSSKFSTDQFFHEYDAAIFRTSMNCLMNLK